MTCPAVTCSLAVLLGAMAYSILSLESAGRRGSTPSSVGVSGASCYSPFAYAAEIAGSVRATINEGAWRHDDQDIDAMLQIPNYTSQTLTRDHIMVAPFDGYGLNPMHGNLTWANSWDPKAEFLKIDDVKNQLPLPPDWYPEQLKGMFWLDQRGIYGFSNQVGWFPDHIISFGDTNPPSTLLDPATRTLYVSTYGPAWTWYNWFGAYIWWALAKMGNFRYMFTFNEDYTFAQIVPTLDVFGKTVQVPLFLINATLHFQDPPRDMCPPPVGASRKQVARCATWGRQTNFDALPSQFYVMHRVVDNNRMPVEPAYSTWTKFAETTVYPDPILAGVLLKSPVSSLMKSSVLRGQ